MKKEKDYYAALGASVSELLKRTCLTNKNVYKALGIGHDPCSLGNYLKVVEFCFDYLDEEEIERVLNRWKQLYMRYRKEKEEREERNEKQVK